MALGALQACRDAAVTINISGRDARTAALKEVEAGNMFGTVSQSAYRWGYGREGYHRRAGWSRAWMTNISQKMHLSPKTTRQSTCKTVH